MVLPEAHASEGKPISSPGRSRFTDSLAPPRTQQSISLKHRLHSTSKLDLRDHCSDHGSVRPQNPRMLLTKKNPFLFLVTRFFFLETNSRFRWPKAATATSGVHPTVFSLPRWQPGDAPPSTMRRGSFSPPSSLGGVVSNGPATMDPSSPPLTPRFVKHAHYHWLLRPRASHSATFWQHTQNDRGAPAAERLTNQERRRIERSEVIQGEEVSVGRARLETGKRSTK